VLSLSEAKLGIALPLLFLSNIEEEERPFDKLRANGKRDHMSTREFDIIISGATCYTGRLVAA
jgi:hypothetical protein